MTYIISVTKGNELWGYVAWDINEILPRFTNNPDHALHFNTVTDASDWFDHYIRNLFHYAGEKLAPDEWLTADFMRYSVILEEVEN